MFLLGGFIKKLYIIDRQEKTNKELIKLNKTENLYQ